MKKLRMKSDTLNPLDGVNGDDPHAIDDCNDMAAAIVQITGEEKEPHWPKGAISFIAATAATTVAYGSKKDKTRSLQTVRDVLSNPAKLDTAIKLMTESDKWGGLLAQMGGALLYFQDKEKNSVMTTVGDYLRPLATPAVVANTSSSSFDIRELPRSKLTIYAVLPPDRMHAQAGLLRLWVYAAIRECVRAGLNGKTVYFVLDEAASIGHMDVLDDAVSMGRGYGIRIIFIFQSCGQVKKCFPEGQENTFFSNTSQVFFAVNDNESAKKVSDRLGEATIVLDSGGTNTGTSQGASFGRDRSTNRGSSEGKTANWSQQKRHLLDPAEVMALPQRTAIAFVPGMRPIQTTLLRYYEENLCPGWCRRFSGDLFNLVNAALVCAIALLAAFVLSKAMGTQARPPVPTNVPNIFGS